jgi:hypothetical protein
MSNQNGTGTNGVQQFDNPAFENDADTSTVSATSTTDASKLNATKAEAVNLEVVNFTAPEEQKNGAAENGVKNGKTEFDGGGATVNGVPAGPELDPEHPDDQYFVSSSNRKKCMRSVNSCDRHYRHLFELGNHYNDRFPSSNTNIFPPQIASFID